MGNTIMSNSNNENNKVILSKERNKISLKKKSASLKVNLNWDKKMVLSQNNEQTDGFFSKIKSFLGMNQTNHSNGSIDLDLGAFVRLKNGKKQVIQALGSSFGNFTNAPYIKLLDDDRTGENIDGEWLEINTAHWHEIEKILVYAFIYEGANKWSETNAYIRVHNGDEVIESVLGDYEHLSKDSSLCAFIEIVNENNEFKITQINRFFKNQKDLDSHYKWGFNWVKGSK